MLNGKRLMEAVLGLVVWSVLLVGGAAAAAGSTSGGYVVVFNETRGLVPNTYGPVKAKATTSRLTFEFNLMADPKGMYSKGPVTVNFNAKGQITTLVKGKDVCTFVYVPKSVKTVKVVTCKRSKSARNLLRVSDGRELLIDCSTCRKAVSLITDVGVTLIPVGGLALRLIKGSAKLVAMVRAATSTTQKVRLQIANGALSHWLDVGKRMADLACDQGITCLLADGEPCPKGDWDDCANRRCGKATYATAAELVCCPSRDSIYGALGGSVYDFCTGQAVGSNCFDNSLCASGVCVDGECVAELLADGEPCQEGDGADCENGVCGKATYDRAAALVCCPSGNGIYGTLGSSEYIFCAGQAVGSNCFRNSLCTSGVCVDGKCMAGLLADGEPCQEGDWVDCKNRLCGKATYDRAAAMVCCPSGDGIYGALGLSSYYFCAGQAVGSNCFDNSLCTSGVCVDGKCVAEPLADGEACPEGDGADCENGHCGKATYDRAAALVCCPSRDSIYGTLGGSVYDFCTGQAVGSNCFDNSLCASGVCVDGECVAELLADGEPCQEGDGADCENGVCGKATYDRAAALVCCPSGDQIYGTLGGSVYDFCTGQAVGSNCFDNSLCASGVCVDGKCVAEKLADGEPCPEGDWDDCKNGLCGKATYDRAAAMVCCPSGDGIYGALGLSSYYFCAGQAVGSNCFDSSLCASGVCVDGKCAA